MIGKLLGALIGREIDRRDGDSGIKGAVLGAAAVSVVRRVGPLGLLLGGAWLAKKGFDRRKAGKAAGTGRWTAEDPPTI
jgi:hypothetical protein